MCKKGDENENDADTGIQVSRKCCWLKFQTRQGIPEFNLFFGTLSFTITDNAIYVVCIRV